MEASQTSARDFAYTTTQPRRSSARSNMMESLDLMPLQRRGQATSFIFKGYPWKSTGDSFSGVLAYINSKPGDDADGAWRLYIVQYKKSPSYIKIGSISRAVDERLKLLRKDLSWRLQPTHKSKTIRCSQIRRLEQIIFRTLHLQTRRDLNSLIHKQFQWFKADKDQVAKLVDRWLQWMISNPYDKEGVLKDPWVRRINYFTSHQQKLQLLADTSPFQIWSMFLDPTWWLRLRTNYCGMTLRQITNTSCTWSSTRSNLRLKYHESSYGQARKSSHVRKSVRAQVEAATPQTWRVHAMYGKQ
ncbi:MAG: hypothetical protein Q9226_004056 [Calogaya cf. arnoldii]